MPAQNRKRSVDPNSSGITSLRDARGGQLFRAASVESDSINEENRTVELSFSSDAEIIRWGDIEILDHSRGACVLNRLNGGANLLFNHNFNDPIGVIESARIDSDGKGRAIVRFGKGTRATDVWNDVRDGILRSVSVGYWVREIELTEKRNDGNQHVYTVRKWEPYELSIVTVPVDESVGVARSEQPKPNPQNRKIMDENEIRALLGQRGVTIPEGATLETLKSLLSRSLTQPPADPAPLPAPTPARIDVTAERSHGANEERTRVNSIMEAGSKLKMGELAERAVKEGKSVDQFREMALEEFDKRSRGMSESHNGLGLSDKEVKDFSMVRLIRSMVDPQDSTYRKEAAYELEVCAAAAERSHKDVKGILIPSDILRAPISQRAANTVSVKTGAGYTGTGANTIETQLLSESFIDILRKRTTLMRRATVLTGLVGNIDIPKQAKGSQGYWIGEDDEAPKDDVTFGLIGLRPHTVANLAEITRKMLMQPSIDVERLVRSDLANGIAQAIDYAGYYGDGSGNSPTGIKYSNPNAVSFAGVYPTYAELVEMETEIADANADYGQMAYVSNTRFRGYAKTTQKFAGGGDTGTIWEPGGSVNGYGTEITNQILAGDVFFGNFADFIIGLWGGLEITVDPFTHSARGRVRLVCMQDLDFEARRSESFTYGVKPAGS